MKKKLLTGLLVIAMIMTLVGCGGDSTEDNSDGATGTETTQQERVKVAYPTVDDIQKMKDNDAYLSTKVGDGTIYYFKGLVVNVSQDYATVIFTGENGGAIFQRFEFCINVYAPVEELASLSPNQEVTVIGQITGVTETSTPVQLTGGEIVGKAIVMDASFDTEITAEVTIEGPDEYFGLEGAWDINQGGDIYPVYFKYDEDPSQYIGEQVTIAFKVIDGEYLNAYVVK